MDPITERLDELEHELIQLRAQLKRVGQRQTLYRALLALGLALILGSLQKVPKWAERSLEMASVGGVGLILFGGNKERLLDFLTRKL